MAKPKTSALSIVGQSIFVMRLVNGAQFLNTAVVTVCSIIVI